MGAKALIFCLFHELDLAEGRMLLDRPSCEELDQVGSLADAGMLAMRDKDDLLLTSSEVAQILDVSPDTVNEFARKSILPGFKKGRQWRFRKRDITSYQRQLRGTTAA
jgi:excisionase family DNA binding protein